MTPDERARATWAYCEAHRHEWDAWSAQPWQERAAIQDKVSATIDARGVLAGREMARALGMPTIPDELCDPVEVLEARHAQDRDEIEELEAFGRVDH